MLCEFKFSSSINNDVLVQKSFLNQVRGQQDTNKSVSNHVLNPISTDFHIDPHTEISAEKLSNQTMGRSTTTLYVSLPGLPSQPVSCELPLSQQTLCATISAALAIPEQLLVREAILVVNSIRPGCSNYLQDDGCLRTSHTDVEVLFRLAGGKGGFGALLKKLTSGGKKTTNFDAMRDLSGRRIRHAKTVERFKKWMQAKKDEDEIVKLLNDGDMPPVELAKAKDISLEQDYMDALEKCGDSKMDLLKVGLAEKRKREKKRAKREGKKLRRVGAKAVAGGAGGSRGSGMGGQSGMGTGAGGAGPPAPVLMNNMGVGSASAPELAGARPSPTSVAEDSSSDSSNDAPGRGTNHGSMMKDDSDSEEERKNKLLIEKVKKDTGIEDLFANFMLDNAEESEVSTDSDAELNVASVRPEGGGAAGTSSSAFPQRDSEKMEVVDEDQLDRQQSPGGDRPGSTISNGTGTAKLTQTEIDHLSARKKKELEKISQGISSELVLDPQYVVSKKRLLELSDDVSKELTSDQLKHTCLALGLKIGGRDEERANRIAQWAEATRAGKPLPKGILVAAKKAA